MTRSLLLAAAFLAGCLGSRPSDVRQSYAPPPRPVPPHLSNPDSALAHLTRADLFMTYHAGLAEDPAYYGTAFRALVQSPDAPVHFARLLSGGSTEGRLYGLAGLWLVDSTGYRATLPNYLSRADTVEVLYGCFRMRRTSHEAVRDVEEGWIVAELAGRPSPDSAP